MSNALRITLIYTVFGVSWILASDWVADRMDVFDFFPVGVQTLKGLLYVGATAVLLYGLILVVGGRMDRERKWYRDLFESNPQPMWVYDLETLRFLEVNSAAMQRYGYSHREFMEMTIADIRPPEEVPRMLENVAAVTEGPDHPGVWKHRRRDGSIIRVEVFSHTLTFRRRRAEMVLAQDVTTHMELEEALRNSQSMLRMASRVSRMGGWEVELREGPPRITWSEEARVIHEVAEDFVPTMENNFAFYVPESRPVIYKGFEECFRDGRSFDEELELVTAKGRRIWVRVMGEAVRDDSGKVFRVQGAVQDVTERKQSEKSLRQSEKRFYELADAMPIMVWVADRDGRVEFANRTTTEYSGIPADENLGERWADTSHPDDLAPAFAAWQEAVRTGGFYQVEVRVRRASDGEYRWHLFRSFPVRDEDGNIVKWYGTGTDIHEVKLAEKRANSLARRLSKTLESITDAFFTLDREWRFTYVNGEAEHLLRRPRAELLGNVIWAEFPDAVGGIFEREYLRAAESGETAVFEAHYSPLEKWFAVRAYPSKVGLAVYFRDITASRKIEEEQRFQEQRLRFITKATNDLIWDFDAARGTIWWGDGFEKFFGPAPESRETSEAFWEERVHPEDYDEAVSGINGAFAGTGNSWTGEYRLRRIDGSYVHVLDRGYILRDAEGKAIRMIGGIMDLTERKQAEAEHELLTTAIGQLGEMVVITDAEGTIQYVNPAYERITGYSREELIGSNPRIVKSGRHDTGFYRDMWSTLLTGETWTGTFVNRRKDGSLFTEEDTISPVRDAVGEITHFVAVKNDVTERISLEEQFRQSQKMEAVGRLAGGIAHDFNNMLTVILVRAEQALTKLEATDPLRGGIQEIRDAAGRSAALTRQLLTYARRQDVKPRVVDLNENVENTLKMLHRLMGENIELHWSPGRDLWPVKIDPVQVDQILANLCVNARDAIVDVGSVSIETHNTAFDAEYCRRHPDYKPGDYVLLAVTDDGAGMDRETLSHLFEPFFTTKETGKGTGLGLATVYGIVRQNNGFIHVYSEPGKGTTFKIYLPSQNRTAEAVPELPGENAPRGRGETVLVVEDEAMILEVTVEILQGLGYKVLSASTPEAALKITADSGISVDALVTDVIMPGMNGRDLAERIRETRPDLPALFMSGYTAQVMTHRGMVENADSFIQKPFSTVEFAVKIRDVLDKRKA